MEYKVVWEAPALVKPEFRLYYDKKGKVICYTSEILPEGDYIIIDAQTHAEARPDVRVVDGKLSTAKPGQIISKLTVSDMGLNCAADDVAIIVNDMSYTGKSLNWKNEVYEL